MLWKEAGSPEKSDPAHSPPARRSAGLSLADQLQTLRPGAQLQVLCRISLLGLGTRQRWEENGFGEANGD